MRPALALAALALLTFNSMAQPTAEAPVKVEYSHPEKFRDASLNSAGYQRGADPYVMKQLGAELEKLASRYLPAGQTLQIDIRDIDLAGRYEPWQPNAYSVRFMRDITWPSIDLHYVLLQDGQVLRQADARVDDKFYLQRPGRQTSSDRLFTEKAMLDEWFRKTFKG